MTSLRLLTLLCLLPSAGCKLVDRLTDGRNSDNGDDFSADTGDAYVDNEPPTIQWLTPLDGDDLSDQDEVLLEVEASSDTRVVEYKMCRLDGDCSQGSGDEYYYGGMAYVYPPELDLLLNEHFFPPNGTCVLIVAAGEDEAENDTLVDIEVCW